MSINYDSRVLVEIAPNTITGSQGLGVAQICFGLSFSVVYTEPQPVTIRDIRIRVDVAKDDGGPPQYLGLAQTEAAWQIKAMAWARTEGNQFFLSLTEGQLFSLERMRNGHGLHFHLSIWVLVEGPNGTYAQQDSKTWKVNSEDWAKVLTALGGDEYLTVAVRVPQCASGSPIEHAVNLVRKAHKALLDGQYDFVVSNCRLAIESARKACSEQRPVKGVIQLFSDGGRTKMTKPERELLIEEATRHYTHLAHHADEVGQVEIFSRDDALLILSATVGVVSSYAREQATQ